MKKVRKIWEENKVLLVLAIIIIICIVVFLLVGFKFFYGSGSSVYGNRLDATKTVKIDNKLINDIKSNLESNDKVAKTNINLKGRVLYINIYFNDDTKMDDAKKIAEGVISLFNDDELQVYDIEISINTKNYSLMGSHNISGKSEIVWNNYNITESAEKQ